jgi:hypothetical protein
LAEFSKPTAATLPAPPRRPNLVRGDAAQLSNQLKSAACEASQ